MEWTWQITYGDGPPDSITAAALEIDDVSYDLFDAHGDVVWSAPTGRVRSVLRGVAAIPPTAEGAPTA